MFSTGKQCRNHPCIYCWGVQNEITIAGESEEVYQKVERLEKFTKPLILNDIRRKRIFTPWTIKVR